MNTYTAPALLDVHGALNALPTLSLDEGGQERQAATRAKGALAEFAPEADKRGTSRSTGHSACLPKGPRRGARFAAKDPSEVLQRGKTASLCD